MTGGLDDEAFMAEFQSRLQAGQLLSLATMTLAAGEHQEIVLLDRE